VELHVTELVELEEELRFSRVSAGPKTSNQ